MEIECIGLRKQSRVFYQRSPLLLPLTKAGWWSVTLGLNLLCCEQVVT